MSLKEEVHLKIGRLKKLKLVEYRSLSFEESEKQVRNRSGWRMIMYWEAEVLCRTW